MSFIMRKNECTLNGMATRDELKALIDQLPENRLEPVHGMLEFHLNPPAPNPEIERMHRRTIEYRKLVEQRFRETLRPGTCAGLGGGGSSGMHEGTPFSRHSFSYWDDKALVQQTLQSFDGQEIEIMERFSMAADRSTLSCTFEVSSGGRTVRHEEEFPGLPKKKSGNGHE